MSLVASRLRITGFKGKFIIWRKLLFQGVLFLLFYLLWQMGWHDALVFAHDSKDSELFIYLDSVVSRLKLKCRDAVIAKTQYLQWILVKFMTILQQGLFVTRGTHARGYMIYHLSVKDGIAKLMNRNKCMLAYSTLPRLAVYRGIVCHGKPK